MKTIVNGILAVLILSACHNQIKLQKDNSDSHITVSSGTEVIVSLPENPTTGYSWKFFLRPEQQNIISDISEIYVSPQKQMPGAGGVKEYKFTAASPGEITITGYNFRPWEKLDPQTAKKVEYTITVK